MHQSDRGFGEPKADFCICPLPPLLLKQQAMENSSKTDYQALYIELLKHLEMGEYIGASPTVQHFHLLSQLHHLFSVKRLFSKLAEEVSQGVTLQRCLEINIDKKMVRQAIHYGVEREDLVADEGSLESVQNQTYYLSQTLYSVFEKQKVNDYIGHMETMLWSPVSNLILFDLLQKEMKALGNEIKKICDALTDCFKPTEAKELYSDLYMQYRERLQDDVEANFEAWSDRHGGEILSNYIKGKVEREMRILFKEDLFAGHDDEDMSRFRQEMTLMFNSTNDDEIYRKYAVLRNHFNLVDQELQPQPEMIIRYLFEQRTTLSEAQRKKLFFFILLTERIYGEHRKVKPASDKEYVATIIRLLEVDPSYLMTSSQWALVYIYCQKCFDIKMGESVFENYVMQTLSTDFEKKCSPTTVQNATKKESWKNEIKNKWKEGDYQLVEYLNKKLPFEQKWRVR